MTDRGTSAVSHATNSKVFPPSCVRAQNALSGIEHFTSAFSSDRKNRHVFGPNT